MAEVGAWWDLSTYKWDGVKDQGDDGDQDVKMHLTKIFMAIFALTERLPTNFYHPDINIKDSTG